MNRPDKPVSELSEAAVLLDQELRKFEELSDLASRIKLTSEKNIERATDALSKAAESQDRLALTGCLPLFQQLDLSGIEVDPERGLCELSEPSHGWRMSLVE